ncbi:hypothetical protein [Flavobacterium aquicola]|uniref:hypothetical protein n=1 Tax=Flavobacterium aquicola TaxID=1682742 RepID=UPI0011C03B8E|nr:hypothetical protein [Flavobacterium aquicola]
MTKYLKYLLSLFLAFGLIVNDGILHSESNSAEYYQVSYFKSRNEFGQKDSKSYVFHQIRSSERIALPILFAHFKLQDVYTIQTRILLKLQNSLYQNISATKAQIAFLSKVITSSNHFSNLYIA